MPSYQQFADATYISLETYRKDGSAVPTPVWVAGHEGKLVVITNGTSFKVKRLRNNPACRLAICNASGKAILSDWAEAQCEVVEGADCEPPLATLRSKYGLQFWLLEVAARLGRKRKDWVILRISLPGAG